MSRALPVLHTYTPALQAELLQQFALLQQTESEAKRQSDDERALVLHMYQAVSQQLDDIRAQLHRRDREDGSTAATLGQVLGVVQAVQKRVDTRTAQAVHHAKAAASSAAAAQQQQGALAEGIKVRKHLRTLHTVSATGDGRHMRCTMHVPYWPHWTGQN